MAEISSTSSKIKLTPDGTRPVSFRASQYDIGRPFDVYLVDNGEIWEIPSDASATLNAVKPDGNAYTQTLSISSDHVTITTDEQLTAVSGNVLCEVRVALSTGEDIGSANFKIAVEKSPLDGSTVSDSSLGSIQVAIASASAAAASAAAAAADAAEAAEAAETAAEAAAAAETYASVTAENASETLGFFYDTDGYLYQTIDEDDEEDE